MSAILTLWRERQEDQRVKIIHGKFKSRLSYVRLSTKKRKKKREKQECRQYLLGNQELYCDHVLISVCFPCLQINQSKLFSDWALGILGIFSLNFGYRESSPSDTHHQPVQEHPIRQSIYRARVFQIV